MWVWEIGDNYGSFNGNAMEWPKTEDRNIGPFIIVEAEGERNEAYKRIHHN